MFIGHFALGFAFKEIDSRVSLATTFLAAQLADTIWPILVLTGVEHVAIDPGNTRVTPLNFESYPWSHSLLTLSAMGAVFAAIHYGWQRRARTAALLGLLVPSHWLLDYLTHRPDMPLFPWSTSKLGLGLWNSFAGTVAIEGGMFAVGIALALAATRARDAIGRWGLLGVIGFLVVAYLGNLFGPPPPSAHAVAIVSVAAPLILLPLVAWIDRHREPKVHS